MQVQEMLNQFTGPIVAYLPNIIGALAVLIVGWLIALIVSAVVRSVLQRKGRAGSLLWVLMGEAL